MASRRLYVLLLAGLAGDAEIGYFHRAVPQNHDVLGLDIPVDDAPAVGVFQGLGDLQGKEKWSPSSPEGSCAPDSLSA